MNKGNVVNNGKSIVKSLKDGFAAATKASELYQQVMALLSEQGVEPGEINTFLYAQFFHWPTKETKGGKKPMGLSNVLVEYPDYQPAKWVNSFSVFRSRWYASGTYDLKEDTETTTSKDGKKPKGNRTGAVATLRRQDIPKYLALMLEIAKKEKNVKAMKALADATKAFAKAA